MKYHFGNLGETLLSEMSLGEMLGEMLSLGERT
jgi:hypothetical protein